MTKPSWQDFGTHDESIVPELWDGAIGAWAPCLGPTGSRLHDMSRRSNWGTLTNMDNATDWVVDGGQYALNFDGINNEVVCGNNPLIDQSVAGALSVWYLPRSILQFCGICSQWRVTGLQQGIYLLQNSAALQWQIGNSSNTRLTANNALQLNRWHHIIVGWATASMSINVNGNQIASVNAIGGINSNGDNLVFGGNKGGLNFCNGIIDDVIIWNRALSANEIRRLYQLGRGGMYQRRRRSRIYIPQAGFQAAWARGSNVLLGFQQP